ncbi:MAG: helix-turn-helix domain-containing protein [Acidimicrobiales bacterium]
MASTIRDDQEEREDPQWTFGDHLAKARRDAGYSQEQMAALIAQRLERTVTKQTISNWENDAAQPRGLLAVIRTWSEITGVREGWLAQNWK